MQSNANAVWNFKVDASARLQEGEDSIIPREKWPLCFNVFWRFLNKHFSIQRCSRVTVASSSQDEDVHKENRFHFSAVNLMTGGLAAKIFAP